VSAVEHLNLPAKFRRFCLHSWLTLGDGYRNQISNDLLVLKLMRVLLPKYKGPGMVLFRGETFGNRRRRTYGLSWTAELAKSFANGIMRTHQGGSVVLKTHAPAEAIICAPKLAAQFGRPLSQHHAAGWAVVRTTGVDDKLFRLWQHWVPR
jgi:hypothetical protein